MILNELRKMKMHFTNKIALVCYDQREVTFSDLYEDVCSMNAFFQTIEPKEIIMVCNNSYQCLIHILGAACAGKRVFLLDSYFPVSDMQDIIQYGENKYLFISQREKRLIHEFQNFEIHFFETSFAEKIDEIDQCGELVFYTSGTSGKSKGIILDAPNVIKRWLDFSKMLCEDFEGNAYISISCSHIFFYILFAFLVQGRTAFIGEFKKIYKDLKLGEFAFFVSSPGMVENLVEKEILRDNVKCVLLGGSKCKKSLEKTLYEKGIAVQNIYGSTEMGGAIAASKAQGSVDELYLAGEIEMEIESDDVYIVCDSLMKEYYKNEELTKKCLRQGRLYIADTIQYNCNGSFSIVGRKDNVIVMNNGFKFSCDDIEEKLKAYVPHLRDACIIYDNNKLIAVLDVKEAMDETVRKAEEYNRTLPFYEKISEFYVCKAGFEYTSLGKLKRGEILKKYREGQLS